MASVRFTRSARIQLANIVRQRGREVGSLAQTHLVEAFDRFLNLVRDFPQTGTVITRVGNFEFRQFPVQGFVVRSRVNESGDVVIVDIRHGRMRPPPLDALERRAEETPESE
jgi:plasmid stabilization system protein ParE